MLGSVKAADRFLQFKPLIVSQQLKVLGENSSLSNLSIH